MILVSFSGLQKNLPKPGGIKSKHVLISHPLRSTCAIPKPLLTVNQGALASGAGGAVAASVPLPGEKHRPQGRCTCHAFL